MLEKLKLMSTIFKINIYFALNYLKENLRSQKAHENYFKILSHKCFQIIERI